MMSEMHSARLLHAGGKPFRHACDEHREAVRHAQHAIAFASLTQQLQEQLQAPQSMTSQQLTDVIA